MRSGTSLFIIAAIPLCLPIIAPAPSVTQLFIFFNFIWHSYTLYLRHPARSCPVAASVMCSVCKWVCGFPLELTYLTKTTNCWSTDISAKYLHSIFCCLLSPLRNRVFEQCFQILLRNVEKTIRRSHFVLTFRLIVVSSSATQIAAFA